ncbi:MAG: tRNA (N(6)-L-threonylcarbamoyladenosine(37)-C(2))-methylthiotransferase MtaB [Coriobacteriales bacterium]|jgi:threonylcarbamoyladenosine tRNA methylthiotransferase MtaB
MADQERGTSRQPRFHVVNLGCKVNRVESDTMAASCIAAGAEPCELDRADVVIVNTCTVTAEADAKTRKSIRHAAGLCRGPVIVTGCAAAIDPEQLQSLAPNVIVEPVQFKASKIAVDALKAVGSGIGGMATGIVTSADDPTPESLKIESPEAIRIRATDNFKTRMDIKIQDGCENACTYCIVHVARGEARSVPLRTVVDEVSVASESNVGEVVLTGINLGGYDDHGIRLPKLVSAILEETPIGRVRISSIEPQHVTSELLEVLSENPGRLCAHFHIPLQSGCDKTLAEMGRGYDSEAYLKMVHELRSVRPDVAISTDVIAGFPGETDEDFEQSYEFCRRVGFSRMHVFRYSRRPGTPAAERSDQVDSEVMSIRAQRLRSLSKEMQADDIRRRIGNVEQVLMMSSQKGMSESYHDVVSEKPLERGALLRMRLEGVDEEGRLLGAPLD